MNKSIHVLKYKPDRPITKQERERIKAETSVQILKNKDNFVLVCFGQNKNQSALTKLTESFQNSN